MANEIPQVDRIFIDEPITVEYRDPPLLLKVPRYPDFFTWRGWRFEVKKLRSEWCDLARRGQQSQNMRPSHLTRADKMGSWGVGRFFFEVETVEGRTFVIYYDRTPRKADEGCGSWILFSEILERR